GCWRGERSRPYIAGTRKGRTYRFANRVSNGRHTTKPDFCLCRMNVYVDFLQRCIEKQQRGWINSMRQYRAISFGQSSTKQSVSHKASIDKEVLSITRCASIARGRDIAGNPSNVILPTIYFQQVIEELL